MNSRLKEERRRHGWRVGYVAEQCGVAGEKTIRRWENGMASPSPANMRRLCTLFGMTAEELGLNKGTSK